MIFIVDLNHANPGGNIFSYALIQPCNISCSWPRHRYLGSHVKSM